MKIAPIVRAMQVQSAMTFKIIHTRQHFDRDMNDVIFEELGIPPPDVFMGAGGSSHAEFDSVLHHSDVVIGLTRFEGIQLGVCNEALSFRKPLVVSDKAVLRDLFGADACVVDSHRPDAIVAGLRTMLADIEVFAQRARSFTERRRRKWSDGSLRTVLQRAA